MGLLKDGYNSFMRYVLNNFFDGFRQVRKKKFFFFFLKIFMGFVLLKGWY